MLKPFDFLLIIFIFDKEYFTKSHIQCNMAKHPLTLNMGSSLIDLIVLIYLSNMID